MSIVFPENPKFRTQGEKIIFDNLFKYLSDDWYIFYEPIINGKSPDFVIFNQKYGIAVLEVKDYTETTLININTSEWLIKANGIVKSIKSPFRQVMEYRNDIIDKLSEHESLLSQNSSYKGNLKLPVINFCCFPNLSSAVIKTLNINKVIQDDYILSKDHILDIHLFLKKLVETQKKYFPPYEFTNNDLKFIINTLYPSYEYTDTLYNKSRQARTLSSENKNKTYKFNNYVDEIFFIVDYITNLYNIENKEFREFIIVYNKFRPSYISSKNFLDILIDALNHKNLPYTFKQSSENYIRIMPYEKLINTDILNKYVFLTDFHFINKKLIKLVYQIIEEKSLEASFIISESI